MDFEAFSEFSLSDLWAQSSSTEHAVVAASESTADGANTMMAPEYQGTFDHIVSAFSHLEQPGTVASPTSLSPTPNAFTGFAEHSPISEYGANAVDYASSPETPSSTTTGLLSPLNEGVAFPAYFSPTHASAVIGDYVPSARHHKRVPGALTDAIDASFSEPSLASFLIADGITPAPAFADNTQITYPARNAPVSQYLLPSSSTGYVQAPTNTYGPIDSADIDRPLAGQQMNWYPQPIAGPSRIPIRRFPPFYPQQQFTMYSAFQPPHEYQDVRAESSSSRAGSAYYLPSGHDSNAHAMQMNYPPHNMAGYQPLFPPTSTDTLVPAHTSAMARSAAPQQMQQLSGDRTLQGPSYSQSNRPATLPAQRNLPVPYVVGRSAPARQPSSNSQASNNDLHQQPQANGSVGPVRSAPGGKQRASRTPYQRPPVNPPPKALTLGPVPIPQGKEKIMFSTFPEDLRKVYPDLDISALYYFQLTSYKVTCTVPTCGKVLSNSPDEIRDHGKEHFDAGTLMVPTKRKGLQAIKEGSFYRHIESQNKGNYVCPYCRESQSRGDLYHFTRHWQTCVGLAASVAHARSLLS